MPSTTTGGPSYEPGREPEDWSGPGIPPEPVPEPPSARAPKAEHVEYAAAQLDVTAEEAGQMTKAELVELAHGGPDEGGDDPSPGISSSTSESKPDKSSTTTPSGPPSPAPTTVSPSPRPRSRVTPPVSSSSADSTDGSTPATGSGQSGSDPS